MKLKLDENLPESLVGELAALNFDADNARKEDLAGRADPDIWCMAQKENRFFIIQDLDFSDLRKFATGTHKGLLLVRLPEAGQLALAVRVTELF